MQVPPLGGLECAKPWTECIAVPADSSQSLAGRSQALLQDQQRPFKPMQRPAERHGEIVSGEHAAVLDKGGFHGNVVIGWLRRITGCRRSIVIQSCHGAV